MQFLYDLIMLACVRRCNSEVFVCRLYEKQWLEWHSSHTRKNVYAGLVRLNRKSDSRVDSSRSAELGVFTEQ